ncbi:MAG: DEAD/DEAH box helicase family protein [Thermodesulfobacteriota bacterium]
MILDQTASQWFQDPEFAKLPTKDKRQVLANYFDGELADDEFRALESQVQDRTRNNFVNSHIEAHQPAAPSRSFGADLVNTVKRAPSGILQMFLQGLAMHDRLADRVEISAPAVGLPGGSEEAPGVDLKQWAAKKAGEVADTAEDKLPFSQESRQGGVRGAVTQGAESALVSLGSKLPTTMAGLAAGLATGLAAGGPLGAAAGYLLGVPLFGAAQYNEAEQRYLDAGYAPEEAGEAARKEAYSEMGFEFGSDLLELLTLGSGRVLTAAGKPILKESLESILSGSWRQAAKKGAAVTFAEATGELANVGTQAEIQRHYEVGNQEFWTAIGDQLGPVGVASVIFGALGGGLHMANIRQTRKALEDPVPDGLDEKEARWRKLQRVDAVQEVEKAIAKHSPALARTWRASADQVVAANTPFDLTRPLEELEAVPQDNTMAGPGHDAIDTGLEDSRRAAQQQAVKEQRQAARRQAMEQERQAAERERDFVKNLVAEQEQAAASQDDPFQPPAAPAAEPPAEELDQEEMSPAQQMMQGAEAKPAQQEGQGGAATPGGYLPPEPALTSQGQPLGQALTDERGTGQEKQPGPEKKTDAAATLTGNAAFLKRKEEIERRRQERESQPEQTPEEQREREQALTLLRDKRADDFPSAAEYLARLKKAREVLARQQIRGDEIYVKEADRLIPHWEKNVAKEAQAAKDQPPANGKKAAESPVGQGNRRVEVGGYTAEINSPRPGQAMFQAYVPEKMHGSNPLTAVGLTEQEAIDRLAEKISQEAKAAAPAQELPKPAASTTLTGRKQAKVEPPPAEPAQAEQTAEDEQELGRQVAAEISKLDPDWQPGKRPAKAALVSQAAEATLTGRKKNPPQKGRKIDAEGRPADGGVIVPGDTFRTSRGRETTPYPKYGVKQTRKDEIKANRWLLENAIAEAEARGDDFNATIFRGEKPENLPPALIASAQLYLFGEQPEPSAEPAPETKPVPAKKTDAATSLTGKKPAKAPANLAGGAQGKLGLHVINFFNGKWGYVGSVPDELYFVDGATEKQISDAKRFGERFGPKRRLFDSEQEAVDFAVSRGHEVKKRDTPDQATKTGAAPAQATKTGAAPAQGEEQTGPPAEESTARGGQDLPAAVPEKKPSAAATITGKKPAAKSGRDLFTAAELAEFDRLNNIDVSGVTEAYKKEALQQLAFRREKEDQLASPDYDDQVRQEEKAAEARRKEPANAGFDFPQAAKEAEQDLPGKPFPGSTDDRLPGLGILDKARVVEIELDQEETEIMRVVTSGGFDKLVATVGLGRGRNNPDRPWSAHITGQDNKAWLPDRALPEYLFFGDGSSPREALDKVKEQLLRQNRRPYEMLAHDYTMAELDKLANRQVRTIALFRKIDNHKTGKIQALKEAIIAANPGGRQDVPAPETFAPPTDSIARGAMVTADTESGRRVQLRYIVVEAADLVTSHDDGLAVNLEYPAKLQPRDRGRAAYRMQVEKIAKAPRGSWLGANPKVSEGAPVVTGDLVVLSGNGRSIALRKAYGGKTVMPYRQWLQDHLKDFGIMAEALDGIREPVLVRQLVDDLAEDELVELAREANAAGISDMSPLEQAMLDAEMLTNLDDFAANETGAIDTAANRPFIRRFISLLPNKEQNTMMDDDGKLSSSGTARIRNAVFAAAYPSQKVVARVVESTDNNIRNITNGMLQAAPAIARMRLDISRGELYNLDITPDLVAAVEDFARLRAGGMSLEAALKQLNVFGVKRTELTERLMRFFDAHSRSGKKINDFLQAYVRRVRAAGNPKQLNLFGQKKQPGAMEALGTAIGLATGTLYEKQQQSLFGDRPAGSADQDSGDGGDSGGGAGRSGSGEQQPASPDRQGAADYGGKNKLVSPARYDELRAKLKDKLGRLHAGFDPELFAIGAEMAAFHIEAGTRKFVDFSRAMLSDEALADVADKLRPYLRSFYLGAKSFPGIDRDGMDSEADIERLEKEINHGSSADRDLERDSKGADSGDGVGPVDTAPGARRDAEEPGTAGGRHAEQRDPEQSGDRVPGEPAAAAGAGGYHQLYHENGQLRAAAGPARGEKPGRGRAVDEPGAPAEQGAERSAADHAAGPLADHTGQLDADLQAGPAKLRQQQKKASLLPVSFYSLENIRESLPFLFPEQQEDVYKAEKRFFEAAGRGMLFTNGTGTGKTYTGLGIARRFFTAGKTEILIVVPKQTKLRDWIADGENLGLNVRQIMDTKDSGPGIVITTYANLYQNEALQARYHDLVIYDESHFISAGKDGDQNAAYIAAHRITADHPDYLLEKAKLGDKEWRKLLDKVESRAAEIMARDDFHPTAKEEYRRRVATGDAWGEFADERIAIEGRLMQQADSRQEFSRTVFLSATPFAHHKSLLYADKYLFDVDGGQARDTTSRGYNDGGNTDRWFMTNLGYRMRYNKLTMPESGVDVGLMERNLHQKLVAAGAVSGRKLEVPFDYSREFVLLDSELGRQIDEGMDIVSGWTDHKENKYRYLPSFARKLYDYHYVNRLLETLKAREAVARIEKHLALGRKVVVFHDYIEGAPQHPFAFSALSPDTELGKEAARFHAKYPQYAQLDLRGLKPAIDTMTQAFGDRVVFYNGRVPGRKRAENIRRFNEDDSGADVIVVLRAAGKEGDSLHDVTGKHSRVFMDLGLPYSPPSAIQGEGRIYRVGQQSDAIMEYMVLHTSFEQTAYGSKINARVRTVENLAMGDAARDLDTAFKEGYLNAGDREPGPDQGKGGKASDGNFEGLSDFARARTYYYARAKKTQRQKSREGVSYFATPEPLGMKMVEWGQPRPGEVGLEPSAGHGAIARFFPGDTTNHFVEPSGVLAGQLAVNASGVQRDGTFEELDPHNKYDFIVMNPPFNEEGSHGNKLAFDHLAKAIRHLRDGGRLVALLPEGPAADKRLDKFYEETPGVYLRGTVTLPSVTFERAATKVMTRILIFDKVLDKDQVKLLAGQSNYDLSNAEKIEELFTRIEHLEMPARLPAAAKAAPPPAPGGPGAVTIGREWHKQKNKEIFTAGWEKRLDRETYEQVAQIARKHQGYWSRFARKMVFENSREDAEAFAAEVEPLLAEPAAGGYTVGEGDSVFFQREDALTGGGEKFGPGQQTADTERLERAMAGRGAGELPRGTITEVSVPGNDADAARQLAAEFGRRVVFFHNNDRRRSIGGAVITNVPGVIYIHANTGQPYLFVFGHELTHRMELDAPHLYRKLRDAVMPLVRLSPWKKYQERLEALQRAAGESPMTYQQMEGELLADFIGENFMAPEFWDQVAAREPRLFVRIARWVQNFLDKVLAIFRRQGKGVSGMVVDLEAARAAAAEAVADFMQTGPPAAAGMGGEAMAERSGGPVFFSAMVRQLADKLPGAGTPDSFAQTINAWAKKGQIKAEELRWSGLMEWLAGQDQGSRLTRDELLAWLAENNLQVKEKLYGSVNRSRLDELENEERRLRAELQPLYAVPDGEEEPWHNGRIGEIKTRLAEIDEEVEAIFAGGFDGPVQYMGQQLLPGGGNYRELLFTLPVNQNAEHAARSARISQLIAQRDQLAGQPPSQEQRRQLRNLGVQIDMVMRQSEPKYTAFQSSHWAEPNVVAHVRFNERTTADGKRLLFIEEVQSDWHQAGRKLGYGEGRVAPAPFAGADKWTMLAMKRMIRWAADHGFDRIGWTTGEQQAQRYDLSRYYREIAYSFVTAENRRMQAQTIGEYHLEGIDLTGSLHNFGSFTADALPGVVGKEIADKIVNGHGEESKSRIVGGIKGVKIISGLELSVGGKGMKAFYDQILPAAVNRYTKKWGVKVRPGAIRLGDHDVEIHELEVTGQMQADALAGQPLFMREPVENDPASVARDLEEDRTFVNRLFAQRDLGSHLASVKTAALQKELQGLAGPASRRRHVLGFAYSKLKRSTDSDLLDMALMVWRDVQPDPDKVDEFRAWATERLPQATGEEKIRIKEQLAVLDRMDRLTPEQLEFAGRIGELFDQAGTVARANKVISGFRDHYVRRLWNLPQGREGNYGSAGSGHGFKVFSTAKMRRKFDTILDGWRNGYDLKVKGLTSSYGVYISELEEILANKDFVRLGYQTMDRAGRRLFSTSRSGQYRDYVELEAPGFAVWEWSGKVEAEKGPDDEQVLMVSSRGRRFFYTPVSQVPELWAVHRLDAAGRPVKRAMRLFGQPDAAVAYAEGKDFPTTIKHRPARDVAEAWEKRKLYAPPQLAAIINKATRGDRLFSSSPALQQLLRINAALKSWILLSSFFHHIAGTRSWALGVDHGWTPATVTDPQTGERLRTTGVNPVAAYKMGMRKIENLHPLILRGIKNGLTLGNMQDWDESALRQDLGYTRSLMRRLGLEKTDAVLARGSRLRQGMADSLFKRYFAGLKAEAFVLEYVHELQRETERFERGQGQAPEVDRIAERVATVINEDFGGLHLQRMGRHPTMQKILRLLLLAPDWTESNFRMVSGLIPGANEWIARMVGDLKPPAGMRPHYNRFFAKVLLRAAAGTFMLQILLNGWDESEEFWKEQISGENFWKFRWLYADISKIYQALGIDLEGKRKVFPLAGHFLDPLKLFDPPRLIKGKGSPLMRAGDALMSGTDWAERPFAGLRDLAADGKTVKNSPHDPKEGFYDRLPATLVNQVVNMQPVQVGYLLKWLQGEEDTLSALLLSAGVGVHNAWPARVTGPLRLADDPVSTEIERLTREGHLHMGAPSRTVTIGGIPQKLGREDYEEYVRASSERVLTRLRPLVESEKWRQYSPERQAEIIRSVVLSARKKVRARVKRNSIRAAVAAGREARE